MLGSAQFVAPKPAPLPHASPPAPAAPGSNGGGRFAQLLNDQPEMLTPPAHNDPAPSTPEAAAPTPAGPTNTARPSPAATNAPPADPAARRKDASPPAAAAKAPGPAQAKKAEASAARPGDAPADAAAAAAAAEASLATAADEIDTRAADAADARPDDPALSQPDASLTEFTRILGLARSPSAEAGLLPTRPAATATAQPGADTPAPDRVVTAPPPGELPAAARSARDPRTAFADRPAGDDASQDTHRRSAARADADADATRVDRRPKDATARAADPSRATAAGGTGDPAALTARATVPDTRSPASAAAGEPAAVRVPGATDGTPTSFAAQLAAALPGQGLVAASAADTPTVHVQAALHSPGFAPELAARVSLLAVDGLQQAQLQLNPADMGPVAVQILVDGAQAQVSFHAAQAETRLALEQSLPDLAAALQGQGLTLSGGGVFQQSSGDARPGNPDAQGSGDARAGAGPVQRAGGSTATAGMPVTASVRRAAGLLDTFA